MSSDLLAEFDSFYKSPQDSIPKANSPANNAPILGSGVSNSQSWQAQPSTQPVKTENDIWGDLASFSSPVNHTPADAQQQDPWGSFGISAEPQSAGNKIPRSNYQGGNIFKSDTSEPKLGVIRRSTLDLFSNSALDAPEPTNTFPKSTAPSNLRPELPPSKGSFGGEILFDADDVSQEQDDDDDEFGDFESVASPAAEALPPPSQSINAFFGSMTINSQPVKKPPNLQPRTPSLTSPIPYPQAPKSPSFQERNPFPKVGLATNHIKQVSATKDQDKPKSASPLTAWPSYDDKAPKPAPYFDSPAIVESLDDDWGDFSDLPAESPAVDPVIPIEGIAIDAWSWDEIDQATGRTTTAEVQVPPPTNIPPPSILLGLFPQLFDLPQSPLFKAIANQPFSLKNRILSDPSTVKFLRAYLLIATVAAHILAGRKLRWKRDTHLSQGMKIGPAGGKGGGMKLAGIDKAEIAREDREATETVRVWKEQLGRLRSAVATANTSLKNSNTHLVIPEIGETMIITRQEGALTAPKACVICGLKREERVVRVDVQIEDSFGEWWVEHWGHRLCRNWWQEHEEKLKFK
ncbi:Serine threonine- kinase ppk6 protein [Rutstroemia sp. NJR-2017a WRK4]|nr:Serine threonine- kinase ppk6 protein [Rutstroemia sp. NJR-2017a WRK4]